MCRVRYRPLDEPNVTGWSHVYESLAEAVEAAKRLQVDGCHVVIEASGERYAMSLEEAEEELERNREG